MKVIALKQHLYNLTEKKKGEVYEADPVLIERLLRDRCIRIVDEADDSGREPYKRRDMKAEH